jgi:RsiW-degrading membrane proteinase PrsW (M82 family)
MNKKLKGVMFLILAAVVTLAGVLSTIFWHFDQLPDPINVIAILAFSFGPPTAMFTYFIYKYKD